jgi:hypothetical protein
VLQCQRLGSSVGIKHFKSDIKFCQNFNMKTYLFYYPIFWLGYLFFKLTAKTFWYPYVSFGRLFVLTKGESNDFLSEQIRKSQPPYPLKDVHGVLGNLSEAEIKSIIKELDSNGYYIFKSKLADDRIEELTSFALSAEAELVPPSKDGITKSVYPRQKPLSPRYQFKENDILKNTLVQELTIDQSFFAVAQAYLGCKPIQDLTAMWWSAAFSKEASSEAAQLYHFDMDRFKFIKFFIYLTDVNLQNGPHCYVKGSHKHLPENLWKDGRIQDKEILESFPKEDILEITGSKGTIIAVDMRGLHKGKVLENGERLLIQFEFTNSLLGATYENIDLRDGIMPDVRTFMKRHEHSFQRFTF